MECSRKVAEQSVTWEKSQIAAVVTAYGGVTVFPVRTSLMSTEEADLRLKAAVSGLADRVPGVSAQRILSDRQRKVGIAAIVVVLLGLIVDAVVTVSIIVSIITLFYVAAIIYRLVLFRASNGPSTTEVVSDEEARAVPDDELPIYTVMIPAYREPEVINELIQRVSQFEYPPDRLDVKLLIEADDDVTIDAIRESQPGDQFELVLVPPAEPRTKPKALNFGLTLARGELVAIYDAEDEPEPLQLRRAAVAMKRLDQDVACIQAKLTYHNPMQNLITKWFTIEYSLWFSFFLPGLASMNAPIPLGGTSNHFRRSALQAMGAWDPFNVTEDADLGIRMSREGYSIRVLESNTYEEANSDFVNWMKQRSRWLKGYLQTFAVHLRQPRELKQELGWKGLGHFVMFVGGTPILAIINPIFWLMTLLWFVAHPSFIQAIFPAPIYYLGLVSWAFGIFLLVYVTVMSVRVAKKGELLIPALLVPLYWVMMSMAAVKAVSQLFGVKANFWEKTVHGLHHDQQPVSADVDVAA
jgi:cellulose synthase/poly-beta-1,6-N-acetylglucosamine synthase-like glycosyltransferase